jgi:outer membrane receptor protein involved in Fe transport
VSGHAATLPPGDAAMAPTTDAAAAPAADAAAEPLADVPSAGEPAREEVIVVEDRSLEPSQTHISGAEARRAPGALGDPVRALTAMPGVVPTNISRPQFYLRGAPPSNTGYFLDGMRVPLLFHAGVASSVVPAALVDSLELFASAAPARYGGIAGGAIAIETSAPAMRSHGEVVAKAYEGGALVESPLADGRGSVLAAARLGYPDLVTALVNSSIHLSYWAYQARATWSLTEHDRIGVLAFGSHDRVRETEPGNAPGVPETEVEKLASDFHLVGLRYDHASGGAHVRAAVTGGWIAQGGGDVSAHELAYGARVELEAPLGATLRARAGVQLQRDRFGISLGSGDERTPQSPAAADPPPRNLTVGGYADVVWDALDDLRLIPGIRFDVYDSTRAVDGASATVPVADPRLAVRWRVRPTLSLNANAGLAHELPQLRVGNAPATMVTIPGFWSGDHHLQRSYQASAGLEWLLPSAFTATMSGFGSRTYDLSDLTEQCGSVRSGPSMMVGPVDECDDLRSTGTAYGLELSLRRPLTERIAGWLSYTLSSATRRYSDASGDHDVPSSFDRRHVASASMATELGAGWRAGARVLVYSGLPYSRPARPDLAIAAASFRLPWYYQVDLRGERRWDLGQHRSLALVLDLLNATFSRQRDSVTCGSPIDPSGACTVRDGSLFVVPSVGVEGSF